jgi:hypothetical protein
LSNIAWVCGIVFWSVLSVIGLVRYSGKAET